MSVSDLSDSTDNWSVARLIALIGFMVGMLLAGLTVIGLALGFSPFALIGSVLDKALATSSVQVMWYITRAAGLTAYLLVWLSTVWGLAVSSKVFDPVLHRAFTYDFHQFVSLLAIAFVIVHIIVLLADQYLPFSVAQILIPFTATYRPVWVGIGIIGMYLTLLVSITFYIRRWIGQKTFRLIHLASYLAFAGTALHGLFSGTDSPLWTVRAMYIGTTLVVVFLTVYRIFMSQQTKRQRSAPSIQSRSTAR
jgi:sulfoxide reductase heme-binding subunit YedZ